MTSHPFLFIHMPATQDLQSKHSSKPEWGKDSVQLLGNSGHKLDSGSICAKEQGIPGLSGG